MLTPIAIICSILVTGVFSGAIIPKSCRPPLPIDWFIRHAQTAPKFSDYLRQNFSEAATLIAAGAQKAINESLADALSIVVGAPWGIVAEYHVGSLRSNDTSDERIVNGNSAYRIGSVSKVLQARSGLMGRLSPSWRCSSYNRGESCHLRIQQ